MKEFLPIAMNYVSAIAHQPEKIKKFLQVRQLFHLSWIPLDILASTYESLSNAGEFTKLEQLEKEEKQRIWSIVNGWVEGEQAYKIKCCKVLRLIEVLQDEKIEM